MAARARRPPARLLAGSTVLYLGAITLCAAATVFIGSVRQVLEKRPQPVSLLRLDADEDGSSGQAIVEVVSSSTGAKDAVTEVIGDTSSRPKRFLYSPGVQSILMLLSKLKSAPSDGSGSALQALLGNVQATLDGISGDEVPPDLQAEFEEAVEKAPILLAAAESGPEDDWQAPLREFSRLRLARRLPDAVDRLIKWEVLFPESLAAKSGIPQAELRSAFRAFAAEIDLGELATWSEQEFEEADDLVQRNAVLKEVLDALDDIITSKFQEVIGTTAAVAFGVAFAPLFIAGLAIAACCACFSGGGGSSPVPSDVASLPLYKLGGS